MSDSKAALARRLEDLQSRCWRLEQAARDVVEQWSWASATPLVDEERRAMLALAVVVASGDFPPVTSEILKALDALKKETR
jgi:hypothetical protein